LRGHSKNNPECTCKHDAGLFKNQYEANPECPVTGHSERVNCVVFSPNGKVIASCSGQGYNIDNSVRLWDAATGAAIGSPLTGHRYVPFPCIECLLSYFGTDLVFFSSATL
jgi:WD40 repeat protein